MFHIITSTPVFKIYFCSFCPFNIIVQSLVWCLIKLLCMLNIFCLCHFTFSSILINCCVFFPAVTIWYISLIPWGLIITSARNKRCQRKPSSQSLSVCCKQNQLRILLGISLIVLTQLSDRPNALFEQSFDDILLDLRVWKPIVHNCLL